MDYTIVSLTESLCHDLFVKIKNAHSCQEDSCFNLLLLKQSSALELRCVYWNGSDYAIMKQSPLIIGYNKLHIKTGGCWWHFNLIWPWEYHFNGRHFSEYLFIPLATPHRDALFNLYLFLSRDIYCSTSVVKAEGCACL